LIIHYSSFDPKFFQGNRSTFAIQSWIWYIKEVDKLIYYQNPCLPTLPGGRTMEVEIPLDKMTTLDKLRALERIWDDLQRKPGDIPSPSWHDDVLQAREERIKEGSSQFMDWSEAKRRIRDRTG
jgi:hypothetical protein